MTSVGELRPVETRFTELEGVSTRGPGSFLDRDAGEVGEEGIEQWPGLFSGPVPRGNPDEGLDRGLAVDVVAHEPGKRLEGLRFLATD